MSYLKPEPPPKNNGSHEVWPLVGAMIKSWFGLNLRQWDSHIDLLLGDMEARDQQGREKYGVPLQLHNGRDALTDAYQEALDLCVYLCQHIFEHSFGDLPKSHMEMFWKAVMVAADIRKVLAERDGEL